MKLIRYRDRKGTISYGALANGKILCLPCLAENSGQNFPQTIEDFIASEKSVETAEELIRNAATKELGKNSLQIGEATFLAPIAFPPKITCLGLNYRDHIREQNAETPDEPVIFLKPHTTIIGPNESIVKPAFVKKLDYEAELAIVIGRKAKNVTVSEARNCIFGYTILNDVSARDIQFKDKQWTRGKGFDTFAPTGPCITTRTQMPDATNLRIRTWVNGELRQNSSTDNMVFSVYEIVHRLSRVMTLEPCDVIATGTPSGVGFALKPEPKFLQDGDAVKIEIEGIGVLENKVIEEKR